MNTVFLNKDRSLICEINDYGDFFINSNHPNKKNSKRLCDNIRSMATLENENGRSVLKIGGVAMAEIDKKGHVNNLNTLTSFETRLFSQGLNIESLPFKRFDKKPKQMRTDLHTHFAGALSPEQLINVAYGQGVTYPTWILDKIGIDYKYMTPNEKGEYSLEEIVANTNNKQILVNAMKIDTSEQETFNKMEDIYAARGPITKNPRLFIAQIAAIARDCKSSGVDYIELSLSSVISDTKQLKLIEEYMPKIEKETGVAVRFLGAIWRHSDKEWNEDEIDRLKVSSQSPYVVGMDVMGHETNSTMAFYDEIKEISKHAMKNDPDFVVRVHAGENPLFKANVRQVLLAVKQAREELKEETGKDYDYPQVRIGHGIYGYREPAQWDEPEATQNITTEELFKEIDPIVEVNKSSNLSLNNINSNDEVPIKEYIDNGVRVVLGTDGKGIYSTDLEQEMILSYQSGLTPEDFKFISKTEDEVIRRAKQRFKSHRDATADKIEEDLKTCYRDGEPHYNDEVAKKYREELARLQKKLGELIVHSEAETDFDSINKAVEGKIPLMITGSSTKHWPKISEANQLKIRVALSVLIECLDKEKVYLVTGGTNHGVEKEAHIIGNRYNKEHNNELVILGTLTEEAVQSETNSIEKNTITHAKVAKMQNGRPAKRWFDLPDSVLSELQEKNGLLLAIGGGAMVSDIIQRAHNMGLNMTMMEGVEGASGEKAESLKGNNYNFTDAKDLIKKLINENKGVIKEGITPEKIDELVEEAYRFYAPEKESDDAKVLEKEVKVIEQVAKEVKKSTEEPENV